MLSGWSRDIWFIIKNARYCFHRDAGPLCNICDCGLHISLNYSKSAKQVMTSHASRHGYSFNNNRLFCLLARQSQLRLDDLNNLGNRNVLKTQKRQNKHYDCKQNRFHNSDHRSSIYKKKALSSIFEQIRQFFFKIVSPLKILSKIHSNWTVWTDLSYSALI